MNVTIGEETMYVQMWDWSRRTIFRFGISDFNISEFKMIVTVYPCFERVLATEITVMSKLKMP
jgi:hypothetical protein